MSVERWWTGVRACVASSNISVLDGRPHFNPPQKLAAVVGNNGYIYTSTNWGASWTEQTSSGQRYWFSIASSSDGTVRAS